MAKSHNVEVSVAQAIEVVGEMTKRGDSQRQVEHARRVEALSLSLAGYTAEQIAGKLRISNRGVLELLNRSFSTVENRNAARMREIENARLDLAQASIWPKVLEGDLNAVNTFLRLSARRAALNGLDAPTKIELGVSVKKEMDEALAELERVILGEVITRVDVPYES